MKSALEYEKMYKEISPRDMEDFLGFLIRNVIFYFIILAGMELLPIEKSLQENIAFVIISLFSVKFIKNMFKKYNLQKKYKKSVLNIRRIREEIDNINSSL